MQDIQCTQQGKTHHHHHHHHRRRRRRHHHHHHHHHRPTVSAVCCLDVPTHVNGRRQSDTVLSTLFIMRYMYLARNFIERDLYRY